MKRKKKQRAVSKEFTVIKKIVPLLMIGLLFVGILVVTGLGFHWNFYERKPEQPIAFSHNKHIEEVGLECGHCHMYADKSPQATVPAVEICVDCHESVATDKPEIKKLMDYWNKKEPIPWVKVHNQDWHVYFTHKRHVKAGIDCTHCHGEVRAMDTVRQVRTLEMGWCLECHREHNAPTDCLACHK
ncbi:MAG: cytochrome c3 family protein [bacterium]|nr:cytochrome c3 family protein [bacterium]